MKIRNITNLDGFCKVIEGCEGKVELVTENGDLYNLKSRLSQYVTLAKGLFNGRIPELELITHNSADTKKIVRYMLQG